MPAQMIRRSGLLALALLIASAVPVRAITPPTFTVVDSIRPGSEGSYALDLSTSRVLDGYLYFSATDGTTGTELWRTNGTNTTRVADIRSGVNGSSPSGFTALGDYLYFKAYDPASGMELWRTNGTTTTLVADIRSGSLSSDPSHLIAFGDYIYFAADGDANGNVELWRTNGTTLGTTRVSDINPGSAGSYPYGFAALGDYLYFNASDGTTGPEVWRTDGTALGTTRVADINPGTTGANGSYPGHFTPFGEYLYFRAEDGTTGEELWRTNGTSTSLVADIALGAFHSSPFEFTTLGEYLYFTADQLSTGRELWRTDGTSTTLVADIDPGPAASNPAELFAFGDYIYFQGFDSTSGYELWRTDGTTLGTMRFSEMSPDIDFIGPNYFTALGDYLYFTTFNGTRNYVYRTDGTATERVPFPIDADQHISCDCYDTNLAVVGGRLFSTVYSVAMGNEFAYLDEPTYVLPETSREVSVWTTTLVILAGLTAAAGIGLRVRGAKRA